MLSRPSITLLFWCNAMIGRYIRPFNDAKYFIFHKSKYKGKHLFFISSIKEHKKALQKVMSIICCSSAVIITVFTAIANI